MCCMKCTRGRHASSMYKVSEYAWDSRASDLSRLDTIDSTSSRGLPRSYDVLYLFTSNGFILLLGGNHDEDQHKLTTLYDVSTNEWHSLDMGADYSFSASELNNVRICELRWNTVPWSNLGQQFKVAGVGKASVALTRRSHAFGFSILC
jgi:hypothetical protein